jgi:tetratricopeptide (TPR) repeat protein
MQLKDKIPMLRRINITITATVMLCILCSSSTLAATKKPKQQDQFLPNPLEINPPDPLRPLSPPNQPLTPVQSQKLEAALDDLDQKAKDQLKAGNTKEAFDIWNRELRLTRYLGSLKEVQALSRVGDIAWSQNERKEVQYITQRLQTIQKQTVFYDSANLQYLQALGQAYQNVRSPQLALEVYNRVLSAQQLSGNVTAQIETLNTMGEINLSWFDYPSAATTYQQLLKLASSKGDLANQVTYLQQLAYIYKQGKQQQESIKVLSQLKEIYQNQGDLTLLPPLLMEIASDYESLARSNPKLLQDAFTNYQQAYTTAWQLEQYVRASEALEKLIALYRSQGQTEDALRTSQILVQTQELAQNYYGLMKAYDQIGQIQLERKDYPQAQAAFRKGLEFAQQLKYNETYFAQQIEKLSGKTTQ